MPRDPSVITMQVLLHDLLELFFKGQRPNCYFLKLKDQIEGSP